MARGSPPRVRGTGARPPWLLAVTGITPACAGNSAHRSGSWGHMEDHPRVCGEQSSFRRAATRSRGSPPRVRGTAAGWSRRKGSGRITPACAGNSLAPLAFQYGHRDHPRVCGEQGGTKGTAEQVLGSPPRVRGTAYSQT